MKKIIYMYLHGDKEANLEQGTELGLSKKALENFKHALYEVEFEMELDTETGETRILSAKE